MSSEKITPPTKPVGVSGGIKQASSNSTITGPNFDSINGSKNWSSGSESGKILGKK